MSEPITYREELKRKAVHLSSLWMVCAILLLPKLFPDSGKWITAALFAALLVLTLISEHAYANGGRYLGRLYGLLFGKMLRTAPHPGQWIVSGGAPVLAAALMVTLLFPAGLAAAALAVMLTGDAAAALIGRLWGRHPLCNGKSAEGSLAFVIVGYLALAVVLSVAGEPAHGFLLGIPAVLLGAAAELFTRQLKIDDNFTIPLCVGTILAAGCLI